MSITDLKALTESWLIEARKLPAAPALKQSSQSVTSSYAEKQDGVNIHDKINPPKLLHTSFNSILQAFDLANIHRSDADNLSTGTDCGDILRSAFGLLDVSAHDAGIGT